MKLKIIKPKILKKYVLNTEKPIGSPIGIRMALGTTLVISFALEVKVAPSLIATERYSDLVYPFLVNIIPMIYVLWKFINLRVINYTLYKSLMRIVNGENLIDYGEKKEKTILGLRKVNCGVKIIYTEFPEKISIRFISNGVKNSQKITTLSNRLEEAFKMNVISINKNFDNTEYILSNVKNQQMEVNDSDF